MLKGDELVGVFSLYRQEVRPFNEKQVELVKNFAAQAVIAIENARLLSELRESLQQQTATADVLKVISRSAFDLKVVLDALLQSAGRLCEADMGVIARRQDDRFYRTVSYGLPDDLNELIDDQAVELSRSSGSGRALLEGKGIQITDIEADPEYTHPSRGTGAFRTLVGVPMIREGVPVGVMTLARKSVRPFTDKQIELVTTFADQAAIAIENVRLFEAEQQHTRELRESLEQQTATSEVLQVISSSPGDLQPVFEAMLEKAVRVCDANFGNAYRWDGQTSNLVASHNTPAAYAEFRKRSPIFKDGSPTGRMLATKTVVHIEDVAASQLYLNRNPPQVAAVELGGMRTFLAVPMLKEGELIGALALSRQEVRPFTDKQIALVQNFAAQAVIAIENARLLNELRDRTTDLAESLEQQTATSEVLKVISSSPGELEGVFQALLENATRICEASFGTLMLYEGDAFRRVALHNAEADYLEFADKAPLLSVSSFPTLQRIILTPATYQIADMSESEPDSPVVKFGHARTLVAVPMLKENELVGVIGIFRREVRPFTDKHIKLLDNFAAQAVIAVENARLLNELRQRTQEVEKLNQHLEQRVTDQVGEMERMGRLRRFLPPQVADLIVASGTEKQLESHRREITALFCDLRGFTGFTEVADAEDVMALLREYHAAVGEIVVKYNGTLER
jgi:two-component system, NtrC family, sensor kinase